MKTFKTTLQHHRNGACYSLSPNMYSRTEARASQALL